MSIEPPQGLQLTLAEELHTLRSQKTEASQKIALLDVEVSELRMKAESSKVRERELNQC
jgi:nucleoprotein TPR